MSDTTTFQRFLPEGFTEHPTTVREALIQGRAVLNDERKWRKGDWFTNANPDLDINDPFCNSWAVCAEGAIGLVTIGVRQRFSGDDPVCWIFEDVGVNGEDRTLYSATCEALRAALPPPTVFDEEYDAENDEWFDVEVDGEWVAVNEFNDAPSTTYKDIMHAFDNAIAKAEKETNNA